MHYTPTVTYPYLHQQLYRNYGDSRYFPFLPFVVGGLAGLAVAPLFYRPHYPPYPYQPFPAPYPGYGPYYGAGGGGYPGQEMINIYQGR